MQTSTPVSRAAATQAATQAAPRLQATPLAAPKMKAVHHDRYGPLELLALRDIEMPTIGDTEVLIRVRAAGLHIGDCFGVHGSPFPMRLVSGLRKPIYGVPGFDVAGQVEAVGSKVTQFRPGDAVFGACKGACAEFVCAPASTLALKPVRLTFEQAAALPTSGLAALHALRDVGRVRPGQQVLINGASGGVGTFAVQLAKAFGAEVTGVCSSGNVDLVRSLGADRVIDHIQQDFTQGVQRYDLILDNVENRSLTDCRRVLTPSGTLILNSGTGAQGMAMWIRLLKPLVLSPFLRQSLKRYLSTPSHADLVVLTGLVEAGHLMPVIDKIYPLHEAAAALRHIEGGHARGKVVVSLPGGSARQTVQPLIAMRLPFSTLGNQPMNYEAASSAAAASAIRPCAVPDSSALQPQLQDAYFHDSYRFPVDDPHWPALGLFLRAASQTPQWVERLMGLRNSIVALVGLKNLGGLRGVDQNKPLAAYRPGQRVGIFTLISVSDDEVLVGDRDRHLDVVVSVLRLPWDGRGQREAVVSTVVHVHGWLGRLYMLPVVPMHRRIVPAVLRGLQLRTPA